jgi:hypothetical protein
MGGRLAIAKNFPNVASFDVTYIFLSHTRYSIPSWLVMYYTSFPWAHVGSFAEQGRIIDVTTAGVIEHPLSDYYDGRSFIIIRRYAGNISDERKVRMLQWLRRTVGQKYAWFKVLKIFWHTISGAGDLYRLRFSADFLTIALVLAPISFWSPVIGILIGTMSAIYVLIVVMNTPKRRVLRQLRMEEEERYMKGEKNMIEALWTVEFVSTEGNIGAGVVIFETNRIFGGDVGYYYLGEYETKNNKMTAKVKVTHYFGPSSSVFGELKEFTIHLSGDIQVPVMTALGYLEENPKQKMVVRCTRRADLP